MGALEERAALERLRISWRRVLVGAREAVRPRPPALPPGGEESPQDGRQRPPPPSG